MLFQLISFNPNTSTNQNNLSITRNPFKDFLKSLFLTTAIICIQETRWSLSPTGMYQTYFSTQEQFHIVGSHDDETDNHEAAIFIPISNYVIKRIYGRYKNALPSPLNYNEYNMFDFLLDGITEQMKREIKKRITIVHVSFLEDMEVVIMSLHFNKNVAQTEKESTIEQLFRNIINILNGDTLPNIAMITLVADFNVDIPTVFNRLRTYRGDLIYLQHARPLARDVNTRIIDGVFNATRSDYVALFKNNPVIPAADSDIEFDSTYLKYKFMNDSHAHIAHMVDIRLESRDMLMIAALQHLNIT